MNRHAAFRRHGPFQNRGSKAASARHQPPQEFSSLSRLCAIASRLGHVEVPVRGSFFVPPDILRYDRGERAHRDEYASGAKLSGAKLSEARLSEAKRSDT